jgi:hypothetical protein
MAVVVLMEIKGMTQAQYDQANAAMGGKLPAGCLVHAACHVTGGMQMVDVWENQAAFEKFAQETLSQVGAAIGLTSPPERKSCRLTTSNTPDPHPFSSPPGAQRSTAALHSVPPATRSLPSTKTPGQLESPGNSTPENTFHYEAKLGSFRHRHQLPGSLVLTTRCFSPGWRK